MFSRATSFASRRTSFAARSLSTSTTTDYQALIMGAPGSGKGTISKRMVAKFGMEVRHPPYLFSPVNLFFLIHLSIALTFEFAMGYFAGHFHWRFDS